MNTDDQTVYDSGATQYDAGSTLAAGSSFSSARDSFARGSMLLSTYRVESEAIKGGMGAVWRVHHTGWNTDLAMKRPQPRMFADEASKENFIRECQSWIELGLHPNIVSCYYVREIGGVPTIFSEWMENGSLENHIEKGTLYEGTEREQQARLLDIAIQFARGLHYAHESGLIHQDVKPDNLLLTDDWQAKMADFGLAKARGVLTVKEQIENIGATHVAASGGFTPAYCSMEQMDGKVLTRRTDIYSWAVSVMEMFLGSRPWANGVVAGMNCQDYFDSSRVPLPLELRDLLADCLEMNPEERPHDFAIVESELLSIYRQETGEKYPRPQPLAAAGNAESLNNRALSYLDLGLENRARKIWREALQATPNHLDTVYNQSLYEWRQGHTTIEEIRHRITNAQGAEDAKERMLQAINAEAERMKPLRIQGGHEKIDEYEKPSVCGAVSPDGKWVYLLRKGDNRTEGLCCISPVMDKWRYPQLFRLPAKIAWYGPGFLRVSPDGRYLLFHTGHGPHGKENEKIVHIVDAQKQTELRPMLGDPVSLCFHPSEPFCYTCQDKIVGKWDLEAVLANSPYRGPHGRVYDVSGVDLRSSDRIRLCVSPENDRLYGAVTHYFGHGNTLLEWRESTGELLRKTETDFAQDICVSPDGGALYTCGLNGIVKWAPYSMEYQIVSAGAIIQEMLLSADGSRLATLNENGIVQIWDTASLACLRSIWTEQQKINSFSASADLSLILTCSLGGKAFAWNVGGAVNSAPWEVSRARSYDEQISQEKEAEALQEQIRDAIDQNQIQQALSLLEQAESRFDMLRFLPLRRELMAFCWRSGLKDAVEWTNVSLTSNENLALAPYADPQGGALLVADPSARQIVWTCGEDGRKKGEMRMPGCGGVTNLCFSRSGRYIAAGVREAVVIWDTVSRKNPLVIEGFHWESDSYEGSFERRGISRTSNVKVAISPDERYLLAGDFKDVGIWDIATGRRVLTLETQHKEDWHFADGVHYFRIMGVGFSGYGDEVVTVNVGGVLKFYSARTGAVIEAVNIYRRNGKEETHYAVQQLMMSPTLDKIYIRNEKRIEIWAMGARRRIGEIPSLNGQCGDMCISPDETMYATSDAGGVRLWSAEDGKLLRAFPALKPGTFDRCLAFSPDSCLLYVTERGNIHTFALKRNLTFPGWAARLDRTRDWRKIRFEVVFPNPSEEQKRMYQRELRNVGFGYVVPGGKPPQPKPKRPEIVDNPVKGKLSRREMSRLGGGRRK